MKAATALRRTGQPSAIVVVITTATGLFHFAFYRMPIDVAPRVKRERVDIPAALRAASFLALFTSAHI